MKKILLSLILLSGLSFASDTPPKDYTIQEQLDILYSDSEDLENFEKTTDFNYLRKYMGDLDKNTQDQLSKLYLYYFHQLKTNQEEFKEMSDLMIGSLDQMKKMQSLGKSYYIQTEKNEDKEILNNITYYVDFDNELLYTNDMSNFVQKELPNLYSIIYQAKYNRLLVLEPRKLNSTHYIIINLDSNPKISFKDLKSSINQFLIEKEKQTQKEDIK